MDDPGSSIAQAVVLVALLGFSALFSGSETAFFSLSSVRLRELQDSGQRRAKQLCRLLANPERLLSTLLVGNTAVNVFFASLMAAYTLGAWSGVLNREAIEILTTILTTVLLLVFGEVTPKAVAAHNPERFAFIVQGIIRLIHFALTPVTWLFGGLSSLFLKLIGRNTDDVEEPSVTEEIIKTAITIGEKEGTVEADERAMIYGIFRSSDTQVGKIMVPRSEMVTVSENASMAEIVAVVHDNGYSRIPVMDEQGTQVLGLVYAKDIIPFLRQGKKDILVRELLRPAHICRPNKKVSVLLAEMRENGIHMAIVVNDNQEVLGLVTLEDLIEEIVGEIIDEHDYDELQDTDMDGAATC